MCGIAGHVGSPEEATVEKLTSGLWHRGPDGSDVWHAGVVHVGVTRLAIIDPGAEQQVFLDESGTLCLVFSGEIYNHRELRDELRGRGHRFVSETDSEVVVHLFEELGEACVSRLRGMFAFAVASKTGVVLARDRLGIKPLYWTVDPATSTFLFASEVTALLCVLPASPSLDLQAFADHVALGHTVGDATMFVGIHCLPAGTTMRVDAAAGAGPAAPVSYVAPRLREEELGYGEAEDLVLAALEDAVRSHLEADVEVALTLSGGIDSTLLALFAADKSEHPLRTFTVADHDGHPDVRHAEVVADLIGSRHTTVILDSKTWLDGVPRAARAAEAPASLFGVSFHLLCERVARDVKSCLHGEGADEVFGGYVEYLSSHHRRRSFERNLSRLRQLGLMPSDAAVETMLALSSAGTLAEHTEAVFAVNLGDPLQRLHLDGVDRSAMSVGLEMRVPYLDDELVSVVGRVPVRHLVRADLGVGKYLLRRLALRVFGERYGAGLLDIVLREKLGAPTAGARLLASFDEECERRLPVDYLERHELGAAFTTKRQLLMFEFFCDLFLRHRGDLASVGTIRSFLDEQEDAYA
ncbi:asparagine synthase (glutamine-hydrolyzing) [Nocardioides aequoreus]|uniref:asparagine synthase (glutamine-hydrolyzing) n=1 Tax=Nocardioides aequoreus TaxID=397278 RepID=UPI0004C410C1|nr:asparagine synthase (glutamine-hydrolyzing) [Nocardioides aequoreus]